MELLFRNTLKAQLQEMDIGTGPGSVPIGLIEFYRAWAESYRHIPFGISFTLVEAEQSFLSIVAKMIESVVESIPSNLMVHVDVLHHERLGRDTSFEGFSSFDLIAMSNFIDPNEGENYENAVHFLKKIKSKMDPSRSIGIIEPGDALSGKALKNTRNAVVNAGILEIFSLCIGIWEKKENDHCSCFWKIPEIYNFLVSRSTLSTGTPNTS